MGPVDALAHLLGLFVPALSTGLIATGLAKLVWRQELARASWLRLAGWAGGAGVVALIGGLLVQGRDGRMLSYLAMVAASALALWWAGFGPARR